MFNHQAVLLISATAPRPPWRQAIDQDPDGGVETCGLCWSGMEKMGAKMAGKPEWSKKKRVMLNVKDIFIASRHPTIRYPKIGHFEWWC